MHALLTGAPSQHGRMYPHRSHRECDVSHRICAPQLSHSIGSTPVGSPPELRLPRLAAASHGTAQRAGALGFETALARLLNQRAGIGG